MVFTGNLLTLKKMVAQYGDIKVKDLIKQHK